jgi:hypothetical protein
MADITDTGKESLVKLTPTKTEHWLCINTWLVRTRTVAKGSLFEIHQKVFKNHNQFYH